jgi:hypothetical protein
MFPPPPHTYVSHVIGAFLEHFFSLISYIINMEGCAVCFALSDCSEVSYDRLHIAHVRGT